MNFYLNPDVKNPNMEKSLQNKNEELPEAFIKYQKELTKQILKDISETVNNTALSVLNTNFSEEEVKIIFKNLSNSAILKIVKRATDEFFETVKILSDDGKTVIENLNKVKGFSKEVENLEIRIEQLNGHLNDN